MPDRMVQGTPIRFKNPIVTAKNLQIEGSLLKGAQIDSQRGGESTPKWSPKAIKSERILKGFGKDLGRPSHLVLCEAALCSILWPGEQKKEERRRRRRKQKKGEEVPQFSIYEKNIQTPDRPPQRLLLVVTLFVI